MFNTSSLSSVLNNLTGIGAEKQPKETPKPAAGSMEVVLRRNKGCSQLHTMESYLALLEAVEEVDPDVDHIEITSPVRLHSTIESVLDDIDNGQSVNVDEEYALIFDYDESIQKEQVAADKETTSSASSTVGSVGSVGSLDTSSSAEVIASTPTSSVAQDEDAPVAEIKVDSEPVEDTSTTSDGYWVIQDLIELEFKEEYDGIMMRSKQERLQKIRQAMESKALIGGFFARSFDALGPAQKSTLEYIKPTMKGIDQSKIRC